MIRRSLPMLAAFILSAVLFAAPVEARAADSSSVAGAVTTASGRLTVRSSPGGGVVGYLNKGSYITLLSKSGSWWQVEYGDGQYGYCHADYITPVQGTPVTVNTAWGNLNVRSGPGSGYERVATLPKGKTVLLLTSTNGWSRILYHGTKTGYVSGQYLSGYSSAPSGYGAISLSLPSFKQTDSRWAHVTIGSSGKTMAKIGCATTAIAMMESHRTGSTITPDAMRWKLSYTPSGSVYWPSHYTVVTNSDLTGIYKLLQQGKPVLYGAKNIYGGQHWVVITGCTGGSTLSADSFTIHDPGSNSRTTLGQFLSAYPTFYKYFHY